MEIRRARPEEIGACAALYVQVLCETFTWLPPERHRSEDFFRAAREEDVYVAVEDGQILGLATLYRPQAFLHSLYVRDRGRGVGKALLDRVTMDAGGTLSLKVQVPNTRAQAFYAREGFTFVERGMDLGSDIEWIRLVRTS